MRFGISLTLVIVTALSACGGRDDDVQLRRLTNTGNGPSEFDILPGKPLEEPDSYSALPSPTPGGTNRTDVTPFADSVTALGGNPRALALTEPSGNDGALLNHSRRFGVVPEIRATLAREDLEVRRRRGRVNILNIGPSDDYDLAYRRQWLDAIAENERLKSLGIATSSGPPDVSRRR
ncbi:MAG: DUF3035 domain-containing protein [Pseudomonadota bacterium]